jgi:hypothetical protein
MVPPTLSGPAWLELSMPRSHTYPDQVGEMAGPALYSDGRRKRLGSMESAAPWHLAQAREHRQPMLPRDAYHEVGPVRRPAHAEHRVAAAQ